MKHLDGQQRTEMLDHLLTLAMSCPVDHCNPANCPLFNARKMELGRRLEWFQSLTDEELAYLTAYHFVCMKNKLEAYVVGACR